MPLIKLPKSAGILLLFVFVAQPGYGIQFYWLLGITPSLSTHALGVLRVTEVEGRALSFTNPPQAHFYEFYHWGHRRRDDPGSRPQQTPWDIDTLRNVDWRGLPDLTSRRPITGVVNQDSITGVINHPGSTPTSWRCAPCFSFYANAYSALFREPPLTSSVVPVFSPEVGEGPTANELLRHQIYPQPGSVTIRPFDMRYSLLTGIVRNRLSREPEDGARRTPVSNLFTTMMHHLGGEHGGYYHIPELDAHLQLVTGNTPQTQESIIHARLLVSHQTMLRLGLISGANPANPDHADPTAWLPGPEPQ